MTSSGPGADGADGAAGRAQADADAAAAASDVSVRELALSSEHHDVERLLSDIWSTQPGQPPLPAHVTRTLSLIGGYTAGAFGSDGELLGAAAGFLTRETAELGTAHLHSHIAGVAQAARGRHVGFALKLHQRAWALSRGIERITWTFDPLVARNAYFNLTKLGARATMYLPDFYGDMSDGINAGQGSDRLLADWQLTRLLPRGHRAAGPGGPPPSARLVLRPDERGAPVRADPAGGGPLACAIPSDIERTRREDPGLSLAWRRAVRDVLGGAMGGAYCVTGFARAGWYVLEPALPGTASGMAVAAEQAK
ncbi:MAG TPA: GNAT family N-acetyltransferase [Streptosporangiaceae bacterium]|nr:GNAT family N-acetyltransferase [Streptosporangiaceae bacterium]